MSETAARPGVSRHRLLIGGGVLLVVGGLLAWRMIGAGGSSDADARARQRTEELLREAEAIEPPPTTPDPMPAEPPPPTRNPVRTR